jgi:hypothetical protein
MNKKPNKVIPMKLILPEPSKLDKLRGWLSTYRLTYGDLAGAMGITTSAVGYLLTSQTARPERVEQLRDLGLPEDLLPVARYTAPGRKPQSA